MPVKGGALPPWLKPGNAGNQGNRNRPDKKAEDAARIFFATGCMDALKEIVLNQKEDAFARIKACELVAKVGRIYNESSVTLQDNRQYSAKIVYLPQLGVEVHQLPAEIPE